MTLLAADVDSDGFDDIIIADESYTPDKGITTPGRILFFKGGTSMSSVPTQELDGGSNIYRVGFTTRIGHIFDTTHNYLIERRGATTIFCYPFSRNFLLKPTDSLTLPFDTSRTCCFRGGFEVMDIDGDGIDDVLIAGSDTATSRYSVSGFSVLAYKGGADIAKNPTYFFHRPFVTNSSAFGTEIVQVGDVTGRGYPSLIITDPQAYQNDVGAVFLYNIGRALKDSCVAGANGPIGSFDRFGTQVIGMGDNTGDGRAEFIVSHDDPFGLGLQGIITAFLGSASYGPSALRESPQIPERLRLDQNYPNPVATTTDVTFGVTSNERQHVTLELYDILGRRVAILFHGTADGYGYTVRVDATALRSGMYVYRLIAGGRAAARMMSVVK